MPSYMITDNQTGKKFKVTGDSPPTEQEAAQIFSDMGGKFTQPAPVKSQADMQKEFAYKTGTPETAAKYGVTSGNIDGVPEWGRKHPNLYGLYGAAKGIGSAVIEGGAAAAGTVGGAAIGAATPVPGGALMGGMAGGGAGFAAGKRLSSAIGLSDLPMDNSVAGIGKDVALGAAMGAIPAAAGVVGKGVRMLPGGDTAMNLLTKVPVGSGMLDAARTPDVAKLSSLMDTSINKAIRPGVAGNRSLAQSDSYATNARTAVKEIVLNKDNLGLTNEFGEPVDHLPKTLPQFRQAIDSTKKNIWDKVEAINTAAGEQATQVPLQSAVSELNNLTTNPVYKTMSPETVDYATKRAVSLGKQGAFTVAQTQDAITLANQSTKNFYQNPSSDTASKAYVDSLIANHLRANLDTALESATGTPAAAQLRQSYGALKTIEKDVNQRAVIDARKNARGLVDFSDIYTAGELVKAIATMNPVGAVKTGAMAAVKAFIKNENNPNTHVERVFNLADKLVSKKEFTLPSRPAAAPVAPAEYPGAGQINSLRDLPTGATNYPERVPLGDYGPASVDQGAANTMQRTPLNDYPTNNQGAMNTRPRVPLQNAPSAPVTYPQRVPLSSLGGGQTQMVYDPTLRQMVPRQMR